MERLTGPERAEFEIRSRTWFGAGLLVASLVLTWFLVRELAPGDYSTGENLGGLFWGAAVTGVSALALLVPALVAVGTRLGLQAHGAPGAGTPAPGEVSHGTDAG